MFRKKFLFILILLIISIGCSVACFGRMIEKKLSFYVEEEVNRVSNVLIREVLNKEFLNELDMSNLFLIKRNDNMIEDINFDTVKINQILGEINDKVIYYFNEFDKGRIDDFYDSTLFKKYDNGVYLDISLGVIFKNPIIYNIGPKIPIKLLFSGDVKSNLVTSVKEYGINTILLEIDVEIIVTEKIIFPFSNKYVSIMFDFPLVIEIISGKVPDGYIINEKFDIIE